MVRGKRGELEKLIRAPFRKIQLRRAFVQSMRESKEKIAIFQRNQFEQGLDADGDDLPDYSPASVNFYGKRPGPWTLRQTGNFYRGVVVRVYNDYTEVSSTDDKTEMLKLKVAKKTGGEVFGLTKQNKQALAGLLMGDFGPGPLAEKVKANLRK